MPSLLRTTAFALLLGSLGCTPADETASIIGGAAGSLAGGLRVGTDSIVAERVLRIGELDGEPEYAFGQIITILAAPDGGFYTCDRSDMRIRRYDDTGRFIRYAGRQGGGPGEYRDCGALALGRDSSLVVGDPASGRFVFFGADDEFTRGMNIAFGNGFGAFLIDTAGRLWNRSWMVSEISGITDESRIPTQYVIRSDTGERLDSVRVPSPGNSAGPSFMLCTTDGCYVSQPYDSLHTIGATGVIALASPRTYHVALRDPDGRVRELRRDVQAVRYDRAEHAEWEAWRAWFARNDPSLVPIPAEKPLLRALRIDDVGRTWVHVHTVAEKRDIPPRKAGDDRPLLTWRERNAFDLFDSESGGFIGRVVFPPATELMAVRGDRVWLREEGEAGEQLIGVYDLKPARR